jgi:hypothetical protein
MNPERDKCANYYGCASGDLRLPRADNFSPARRVENTERASLSHAERRAGNRARTALISLRTARATRRLRATRPFGRVGGGDARTQHLDLAVDALRRVVALALAHLGA